MRAGLSPFALAVALVLGAVAACDQGPFLAEEAAPSAGAGGGGGGAPPKEDPLSARFPTAGRFFEDAIRPSCAQGSSCHGGWAAPRLLTFADLEATFGARCQAIVADARAVVDACEVEGDSLVFEGGVQRRILRLEVAPEEPAPPLAVTVELDGPAILGAVSWRRSPRGPDKDKQPDYTLPAGSLEPLETDRARLSLAALPEAERAHWDERDYPRGDADVLVWDANRNGTLGSTLGTRLAVPGDARRSYLWLRLLSDDLGSRMPLLPGNWDEGATRALGCFLRSPVKNDEPLALADCPPDLALPGASKVGSLLSSQCAFAGCHDAKERAAALNLTPDGTLGARLAGERSGQRPDRFLVSPSAPDASYLLCKTDPACADRMGDVMPRNLSPLSGDQRDTLRAWIAAGTPAP